MSKILICLLFCLLVDVRSFPQEETDREPKESRLPLRGDRKSIFTTIQSFIRGLYQEFLNRQQSIANLLTCGNCVNEGWDAIMSAVANVPGLEWAYKPHPPEEHPPNFFTALNHNGVITGFGGSIVDNRPIVEFVFDHEGIVQRLNNSNSEPQTH